jgi:hypothetical protein
MSMHAHRNSYIHARAQTHTYTGALGYVKAYAKDTDIDFAFSRMRIFERIDIIFQGAFCIHFASIT